MKKYESLIYVCITLTLINLIAILFFLGRPRTSNGSGAFVFHTQAATCTTADVTLPGHADFAGEPVPLYRADVQEAMRKELIVNTYLHSRTLQVLKNLPRMFSRIEPILKSQGVPDDFKYLAVIESDLNPLAVSPSGAVGVWQFLAATGKEGGLEVNDEVDERYNVERATVAACKYLKKAYAKFGSWTLAAAAYNAGNRMVQKQIDTQRETNYYSLLLGEETERYVFRILAMKQILNQPSMYNFAPPAAYPVEKVVVVRITGAVADWAVFAHGQGITYKTLKRFNPWLRKNALRNPAHRTYEVRIPVNKASFR